MADLEKKEEKSRQWKPYSCSELSAFCLQVSLLLEAAVPLDEGFSIMAEDAADEKERQMLLYMSEGAELGDPCFKIFKDTGVFPDYVIRMAKLGQETGTLDQMMKSLSDYYEKEDRLIKTLKNAVRYPAMMILMLLVVLFVLFVKVMPIFSKVYEQLGAEMSSVAQSAIRLGGTFSGAALVLSAVIAVVMAGVAAASKMGIRIGIADKITTEIKNRSKIAHAIAKRRFTSVLSLTLRSGLEFEKGLELAGELAENDRIAEQVKKCEEKLELGESYYEALKETGMFSGFYIQMIKVGTRSGHLDSVMEEISNDYEEITDTAIDNMIARFEPTIVAVLAVSVGCCNISSHGGINFFDHIAEAVKIHIFQRMGHYLICMIRMNCSGLCINDNGSVCTHRLSAKQHFCWKTSSAQLDSGIIGSGKIICNDQVSFFQPFHRLSNCSHLKHFCESSYLF